MNVYIRNRETREPVARVEVHLAGGDAAPSDDRYFEEAWKQALADGLVTPDRDAYDFQLQQPKNLFEASR